MNFGLSFRDVREKLAAQKAAAKKATQAQANRGAQGSNLGTFMALYDADPKLMAGKSVDATTVNPQQWNADTERAGEALVASLKSAGHELTDVGLKKFVEYLGHHHIGNEILDLRRVDVLVAAFNRFSELGGFNDGDFKSKAVPQTQTLTGRAREDADRAEYLADLRKELGEAEFQRRYGNQGLSPLGARRPNTQI
jgi:hypothetical protein